MFIELTDHLRCTEGHAESFLVLLTGKMRGREVVEGSLGCPVCGRVVRIEKGVADFGGGRVSEGKTGLSAEAVATFLGITGPGGFVALVGGVGSLARELAKLLPDVSLALVNPPEVSGEVAGVLRAGRMPIKSKSLRGVVLGADVTGDAGWVRDGAAAVLPGLHLVGEGGDPPEGLELLGEAQGCWVSKT